VDTECAITHRGAEDFDAGDGRSCDAIDRAHLVGESGANCRGSGEDTNSISEAGNSHVARPVA
jgi:hypothetical protein